MSLSFFLGCFSDCGVSLAKTHFQCNVLFMDGIPQQMTDSIYCGMWVCKDSVCWEWDNPISNINGAVFF